jgi:hypothetical protein
MTPEELRRTIEFIVESQARLAAAREQDREERIEFQKSTIEFKKWAKEMNLRVVGLIQVQTQALEVQSRRLDQYEAQQRAHEAQHQRAYEQQERAYEQQQRGFENLLRTYEEHHRTSELAAQRRHEELLLRVDRVLMLTTRLN